MKTTYNPDNEEFYDVDVATEGYANDTMTYAELQTWIETQRSVANEEYSDSTAQGTGMRIGYNDALNDLADFFVGRDARMNDEEASMVEAEVAN